MWTGRKIDVIWVPSLVYVTELIIKKAPKLTEILVLKVMLHGPMFYFYIFIFSAAKHYNVVATLFRMVATLLQHSYDVLRSKSSLRIVSFDITLTLTWNPFSNH